MTLKELAIGKSAVIRTVGASGALRQHFLDMGMIPGGSYGGKVCTDGRPNGIAGTWI